jgi:hypothetical protein
MLLGLSCMTKSDKDQTKTTTNASKTRITRPDTTGNLHRCCGIGFPSQFIQVTHFITASNTKFNTLGFLQIFSPCSLPYSTLPFLLCSPPLPHTAIVSFQTSTHARTYTHTLRVSGTYSTFTNTKVEWRHEFHCVGVLEVMCAPLDIRPHPVLSRKRC